ncbi:MAG: RNase J family beta-CASP ribonuclease [Methanobacteriota archaeon]
MEVEVLAVGGYNEFGRNMTAVRVGGEVALLDMGVRLDRVLLDEDFEFDEASEEELRRLSAIPDDEPVRKLHGRVSAIVLGHGHLDHIGAVPRLAHKYKGAPLYGTPYTMALVENSLRRQGRGGGLRLQSQHTGKFTRIGRHMELELVHVTHSIAQSTIPVIHTPKGAIVYASDFKFDNYPVLGAKSDTNRLRNIGADGVLALIVETTNAEKETKTPSETIARDMLKDYILGLDHRGHGLILTTFSSHTARIKSICEFGRELGRRVVLLGNSMERFIGIAQRTGALQLPGGIETYGRGQEVERALKKIVKDGKEKYLLVATGHQGEPNALLSRIADKETPYKIADGDRIVFSADVIPSPVNAANRYVLETKLSMQGAIIIKGAHASGHGSREDHRELLKMLEPEHVIPCHGDILHQGAYAELAERHGWKVNHDLHILRNGMKYKLE